MDFDIFNGDADGIFSLHQYRLHRPTDKTSLITGVKRDVCLLSQIETISNASLAVFDISLDSNRASLLKLLSQHNKITYFDHHYAGTTIQSSALITHIDHNPDICTSLIVNEVLHGRYDLWAICGAFGDNLHHPAMQIARTYSLSKQQTNRLQQLGELFNYNSYGSAISDLHFHPGVLYEAIRPYKDPFEYLENSHHIDDLHLAYQEDISLALKQKKMKMFGRNRVYHLPALPWARRVAGVFSNLKAREDTTLAHAIITENPDETFRISVRAPLEHPFGADTLCNNYPNGGGRAAAAGINSLPRNMLDGFLDKFQSFPPWQ
jgi:hypothetical protein